MPIEIIAEVANAHQGDPATALRIAWAGLDGGADAVKFQVYFADELLVRAHPRFDHFDKQSFAPDVWPGLIGGIKERGGRVICDVFGVRAVDVSENCGADGYKVHTSDLGNIPLLQAVRATGKPVYLSSGGSTARELATALGILGGTEEVGARRVLMHGYQSFPTPIGDARLTRLAWLKTHFGHLCDIGYQDHVDGDNPFAFHLPLMALAMGATVIEKHMTLHRAAKGIDYYSSITPDEFSKFCAVVRQAETALVGDPLAFSETESNYRRGMKKFWVTAQAFPAGHVLKQEDIVAKRVAPDAGPPNTVEAAKLIGHALLQNTPEEHPLCRADLKQRVCAVVVARMASSRMPGKAMAEVNGQPTVLHLLERLKLAKTIDDIVLCTTTLSEDDPIVTLADRADVRHHRGPVEDVLGRMLGGLEGRGFDVIVRITGDDILVDPHYLDAAVHHHLSENAEHTEAHALPSGTEAEIFDADVLFQIHEHATDPGGTEYLTWYVTRNGDQFRKTTLPIPEHHSRDWRLTIDTPEDHDVVSRLLTAMAEKGKALSYTMDDIVDFFETHPELLVINANASKRSRAATVDTRLKWGDFSKITGPE